MRYRNLFISTFFSLIAVSCTSVKKSADGSLTSDGKLWSSLWQQQAAEYKALCFQAYNFARQRTDEALTNAHSKPIAIVTDIDETVLDNSPNAVGQALQGKDFNQEAWYKWTNKAACDTVPGAASFFKYAANKGVSVFYITNRDEREREATLKNLQAYHFPFADSEHLLLRKNTSAKEPRRSDVMKTHDIILLIGDNLSDFSSVFDKLPADERTNVTKQNAAMFGSRFIVIPNANYGDWENSLFRYNYKLSPAEKEQLIKKVLRKE